MFIYHFFRKYIIYRIVNELGVVWISLEKRE